MYTGSPSPVHSISTTPPSRCTLTGLWARPCATAATATAHEPDPEARVSPAPRSQILILTSCSPRANPNSTFVRSGKTASSSMGGPTVGEVQRLHRGLALQERHRVRVAHRDVQKVEATDLDLFAQPGRSHVHPRGAVIEEDDLLDPRAGGDGKGWALDHVAVGRVAGEATQAVAAHLGGRTVGVQVEHLQVGDLGGNGNEYSVGPDAEVPVAGSSGEVGKVYLFDLARVEDEKIVAAALHLREAHGVGFYRTGGALLARKIPLGAGSPSRIFPP